MVHKSWARVYFFGVRVHDLSHKHMESLTKSKGYYLCIRIVRMKTQIERIFARCKEEPANTFYDDGG